MTVLTNVMMMVIYIIMLKRRTLMQRVPICSRLKLFVPSFQGSARLRGKYKNRDWLGLGLERRVEYELGSGSA